MVKWLWYTSFHSKSQMQSTMLSEDFWMCVCVKVYVPCRFWLRLQKPRIRPQGEVLHAVGRGGHRKMATALPGYRRSEVETVQETWCSEPLLLTIYERGRGAWPSPYHKLNRGTSRGPYREFATFPGIWRTSKLECDTFFSKSFIHPFNIYWDNEHILCIVLDTRPFILC